LDEYVAKLPQRETPPPDEGPSEAKTERDIERFLEHRNVPPVATPGDAVAPIKTNINIEVEDADLRDIVAEIGRRVKKPIIVDGGIDEKVTISLQEIPWRDSLDVIARMQQCEIEPLGEDALVLVRAKRTSVVARDEDVRVVLSRIGGGGVNLMVSPRCGN